MTVAKLANTFFSVSRSWKAAGISAMIVISIADPEVTWGRAGVAASGARKWTSETACQDGIAPPWNCASAELCPGETAPARNCPPQVQTGRSGAQGGCFAY